MGILRRLREWREDKNGTLIGPDIDADSVNTDERFITNTSLRVEKGASQNIPSSTNDQVEWETTDFDDRGEADLNNNQIVVQNDGKYFVAFAGRIDNSSTLGDGTVIRAEVQVNGVQKDRYYNQISSGQQPLSVQAISVFDLSDGDTITFHIFHDTGSTENLNGSAENTNAEISQIA